jgi:hypothetical protein
VWDTGDDINAHMTADPLAAGRLTAALDGTGLVGTRYGFIARLKIASPRRFTGTNSDGRRKTAN